MKDLITVRVLPETKTQLLTEADLGNTTLSRVASKILTQYYEQNKNTKPNKQARASIKGREVILKDDLNRWRASGPYDINRLFSHENDILLKIARINAIQRRILDSLMVKIKDLYLQSNFKPLENEILN